MDKNKIALLRKALNESGLVLAECADVLRKAEKIASELGFEELNSDCKQALESINKVINL